MSRQMQHEAEVSSVTTKTDIVEIEVQKNYKKNVATQKLMLRHNKELKEKTSVTTKRDYVATIKVYEQEIYVVT